MKEALRIMGIVAVLVALTFFMSPGYVVAAEKVFEFKISIDTAPSHHRNQGLVIFMEELQKRSRGKLIPHLYHSAQLYKDSHLPKALRAETVDMAVPGTHVLEGVDPNASITMLPMFFGQSGKITEGLVDGPLGKETAKIMEKKLGVICPGRWMGLGPDDLFTTKKKIVKMEDCRGLKLRHSGGSVREARYHVFGATPIFISWADTPMALMQGTVDGVGTTPKSLESAKLHEAGIKYAILLHAYQGFYIPMVTLKFWNRLPADLQKIFMEVWDGVVIPRQREITQREQEMALKFLAGKGVEIYAPSDKELAKWREKVMVDQDRLIKELHIDTALTQLAKKALGM